MSDASLSEPFPAPEVYVEGFTDYEVKNGVLTCAGYRTKQSVREVVLRIVMPVANLANTITEATAAARDLRYEPAAPSVAAKMLS